MGCIFSLNLTQAFRLRTAATPCLIIAVAAVLTHPVSVGAQFDQRVPIERLIRQFGQQLGAPQNLSSRPSINCTRVENSVAQIICSDNDGAGADWALNAAIWATEHTAGETGRADFQKEQESWRSALPGRCGLPPLFSNAVPRREAKCVIDAFKDRARTLRRALPAEAQAEVKLSPDQRAAIQRELIARGFLNGIPDGEFGPNTREAIRKFQAANSLEMTGFLPLAVNRRDFESVPFRQPPVANREAPRLTTPNIKPPFPEGNSKTRFSGLLALPSICEQLQRARSKLNAHGQAQRCSIVAQCRMQLNERAVAVDTYLKENPEVSRSLRNQKVADGLQSTYRDFGAALLKVAIPDSQNCNHDRHYIDRFWVSLRDVPSYGPRPFEMWVAAGRNLLSGFHKRFSDDERTYNDLLQSTDTYPGRDALVAQFEAYRQSILNEDFEAALHVRLSLVEKLEVAKQRKQVLSEQGSTIRSKMGLVSDWTDQLSGPLTTLADEAIIRDVRQLKLDLEALAERREQVKQEVSSELDMLSARAEQVRPRIEALTNASRRMKELSDARAAVLNEIPEIRRRFAALPNSRLTSSETRKLADLDSVSAQLAGFRPDDISKQAEMQAMIERAKANLSDVRTAVSQQESVDALISDFEKMDSKVSSRGRELLDSKTESAMAELLTQLRPIKQLQFPLNDDQLRTYSSVKESFDRVASNIDAVLAAGEKRQEVQRLGDQYARDSGTRWSLDRKFNPMTDKTEYKVSSLQKNGEGAVAEIEGKCPEPGLISFTALIVDEEGNPTVSFPQYNSAEQALIGNRRINSGDPQIAILMSDRFNNRFSILFLLGQPSRSAPLQSDKSGERGLMEEIQLMSKALQVGLVGAQKPDETWRVLVQIETSRGSFILKIPTFNQSIRKLIDACT